MIQRSLRGFEQQRRIVNVASVPQRSPFRYPGGKTWLVPQIRLWLASQPSKPSLLLEPFAGGGIVSLTAAFENLVDHVMMVELDSDVAAVWEVILGGDAHWLADEIINFDMTPTTLSATLQSEDCSLPARAFRTILRNRTSHGGILAPGSGTIKFGENGKGILSRWYPETLAKRIRAIDSIKDRISFIEGDGLAVMRRYLGVTRMATFIDPPYTAAGKKAGARLYTHSQLDHEELFILARALEGDFLMTYDNADGVRELASRFYFDTEPIPMKNTHHAAMTELLVGKSLDWIRV